MSIHPREHEELLAALAAGERALAEPEVERRLRECPDCARAWAAVRDAQQRLERLGAAEREALDQLPALRGSPGEERVLPTLERLAAQDPHTRGTRRPAALWLAAAVVLVVGAWALARLLEAPREDRKPSYLGEELSIVGPRGPVESYASFSWTYENERTDTYCVRIYDAHDRDEPLREKRHLEETSWTPTAEELEGLPARIFWVVEALDALNNLLDSASAEAWRSR